MFLEDFEDIVAVSEDGKVKVVIEWIGEGIDGDYDEEDPDDEPLCRFSVYRRYDRDERMDPHFLDDHTPWGEYGHRRGLACRRRCLVLHAVEGDPAAGTIGESRPPQPHTGDQP